MINTTPQNATLDELSTQQELALGALLAGETVTQSADAAGVDRTTVHRWLREDFDFIAAINRGKRELRDATQFRLLRMADAALDCVEKAITDGDKKIAVELLRGIGLLSGDLQAIGGDDAGELESQAAERAKLRDITARLVG